MEQNTDIIHLPQQVEVIEPIILPVELGGISSSTKPFIEANTSDCCFSEIKEKHVIPVWLKDNEPLISHADFIQATSDMVSDIYHGERILQPSIRVSHPIKGRIPSAKDKPAHQLQEHEKTLFYERMMFVIEIPSIQSVVDGNILSLMVGGIKSFGEDNLYQRTGADQHFKIFIGFQNKVCTNLCVWSDGYTANLSVKGFSDLLISIKSLIQRYSSNNHLFHLEQLTQYSLSEHQFAQLIGRCRMYQHLPNDMKQSIPPMLLGEQQMGAVVRDYYRDDSFCRDDKGDINLWRLYNLLTGANKSSYIDSFLDRSVNAYSFAEQIRWGLEKGNHCWYLP
jgi:hypothetical protein